MQLNPLLRFPVFVIPEPHEAWATDGAIRGYHALACGNLPAHGGKTCLIGFQGAGVFSGKFIFDFESAQSAIKPLKSVEEILNTMRDSRGSLAIQTFFPLDQSILMICDPLGGAPIYRYRGQFSEAFSSDLGSLIAAIRMRGDALTSEPKFFASGLLTGTQSYGADSPFKEISVLRRGYGVKIHSHGAIELIDIHPKEDLYQPPKCYEEAIQAIRRDLLLNVSSAASQEFDVRTSHLTGGFDSRLVLSAILALNVQDQFIFSCIQGSSDWGIASQLAGEIGLTFSSFDGNYRGSGYALNYFESIKRSSRRSMGAIVSGIDPSYLPSKSLVFQGGYGEVGRTFNSFLWKGSESETQDLAYQMWKYAGYPSTEDRPNSIWNSEFLDEMAIGLKKYTTEANALGLERDFWTNYIYVEGRNRNWIGLQSFYASGIRAQFDPIYSRTLVSAPRLLSFEHRRHNFLGLDLMRSLSPKLTCLPFDKPRISPSYEKMRGKMAAQKFSGINPKLYSPAKSPTPKPWPGPIDEISPKDIQIAKSLSLSSLLVSGVHRHFAPSIEIITHQSDLASIFNADRLSALWNGGEPKSKNDYETLHKVISILVLSDRLS